MLHSHLLGKSSSCVTSFKSGGKSVIFCLLLSKILNCGRNGGSLPCNGDSYGYNKYGIPYFTEECTMSEGCWKVCQKCGVALRVDESDYHVNCIRKSI